MGELEGRMICRYSFDQDDPHHFYDEMFKHFPKVYIYHISIFLLKRNKWFGPGFCSPSPGRPKKDAWTSSGILVDPTQLGMAAKSLGNSENSST